MTKSPLFFIALLPDEKVRREITGFKKDCARLFQARHALTSPPHITLIPPFLLRQQQLDKLGDALGDFAASQAPFSVYLQDFDAFPPRVIYVGVLPNDHLTALQLALEKYLETSFGLKKERPRGFHPHVTIAHRDLDRRQFQPAWEHFSNIEYRRTFLADSIALLEHARGRWEVCGEYAFA
jgi:2'-5' RNA ligase